MLLRYVCLSVVLLASQGFAAAPPAKKAPAAAKGAKAPAAKSGAKAGNKTPATAPKTPAAAPATPMEAAAAGPTLAAGEPHLGSYGMAGCGLGSIVIKNPSKGPQIGAFFLNAIGFQTSALTSGTSNCVESRTETAAQEQSVYVIANLSSLSREAAQGGGEHLDGLAEVFGCHGASDRQRLAQLSQEKFDLIFSAPEADGVLDNYLSAIQMDPLLASECTKVI